MMNVLQILAIYFVLIGVRASRYRVRRGLCSTRQLDIINGDYNIRSSNSVVKYTCNRGFFLYGVNQIVCFGSKWSGDPPICISNTCQKIQATSTLRIKEEYRGSLLKFSCAVLYKLLGSDRLLCDGEDWNDNPPTCQPWEPPTSCDFEDPALCGWSHHDDDDVDWRYNTGGTTTSRTGPEFDHTLGAGGSGHYLFFESSSPTRTGHKAILKSPLYPASYSKQRCFSMWYHILGVGDIGDLELFIKPENVALDKLNPVFKKNKNLGELWYLWNTSINVQTEPFQIYIVGTRGSSYRSDFAIDDVSLYECAGTTTPKPTSAAATTVAATTAARTATTTAATTAANTTAARTATTTAATTAANTTAARVQTQSITTVKLSPKTTSKTAISTLKPSMVTNGTTTMIRKTTQNPTQRMNNTDKKALNTAFTSTSDKTTLEPQINPNIPAIASKQSNDNDSSNVVYILVGVGLVVAIALAVGVGLYCYRRDRSRHDYYIGTGSVNPLYDAMKNDEAAISFANDDYTHI